MACPKCRSDFLMIRQRTGFERIRLLFTDLRKYVCRDCGHTFQAPDRRRATREEDSMISPMLGDLGQLRSSKKVRANATGEKTKLKVAARPTAGREANRLPKSWLSRNRVPMALLGVWTCLAAALFASHDTATAAGFGAVWLLGVCGVFAALASREAQLRERSAIEWGFHQLFDEAPIAQHELDGAGIILRVNREYCAMLGYEERELVGRPVWDFVSGSDPTDGQRALTEKMTGEQPLLPFLRRYLRKDGSEIMLEIRDSLIRGSGGAVSGVTTSLVDVTERHRAQEALRESEETSRSVGDAVLDALIMMDVEGRVTRWNPAAERMFGYGKAEIMGQALHDRLVPAEYRATFHANFPKFCETGTGPAIGKITELRGIRKDGSEFPLELSLTGVRLHDRWQAVGIVRDITERKRADAYRDVRTEVLRVLAEPGDLRGCILRVIAALKTWTGFDAVAVRLKDGDDFPYFAQDGFPKDFLLTENTLIERGADGRVCRDKDGKVRLECTCGLVISGKTDPSEPFYTQNGSFAANDSSVLLDLPPDRDLQTEPSQPMHSSWIRVGGARAHTG